MPFGKPSPYTTMAAEILDSPYRERSAAHYRYMARAARRKADDAAKAANGWQKMAEAADAALALLDE